MQIGRIVIEMVTDNSSPSKLQERFWKVDRDYQDQKHSQEALEKTSVTVEQVDSVGMVSGQEHWSTASECYETMLSLLSHIFLTTAYSTSITTSLTSLHQPGKRA